jgi:hypothetical protein
MGHQVTHPRVVSGMWSKRGLGAVLEMSKNPKNRQNAKTAFLSKAD